MTTNEKRIYINNLFKSESLFRCLLRAKEVNIIDEDKFNRFHTLIRTRTKKDWWNDNKIILLINVFYELVLSFQNTLRYKIIFRIYRKFWEIKPYDFSI